MDTRQYQERKRDHLRHALNPANQALDQSGLDRIHLNHEALPELDFDEVSMVSVCLGTPSATPFFIAAMTAGHEDAVQLNETLALACAERGWALGVGSQRVEIADVLSGSDIHWKRLRDRVPSLQLIANLGLSQLPGMPIAQIQRLLEATTAQALAIHTNPLQECFQPEGTPQFRGGLQTLKTLCQELNVPVLLKETGCGFTPSTLSRLSGTGLRAVDVSGLGGTHWGRIEGARAAEQDPASDRVVAAQTFANWGESTVDSVLAARQVLPAVETWASGGVRTGLDAAKLVALGAVQVGFAQPALAPAMQGHKALVDWMRQREFEFRVALFCSGCSTPQGLRQKQAVWRRL